MGTRAAPPAAPGPGDQRGRMNQPLRGGVRYGGKGPAEQQEAIGRHFAGRPVDGLRLEFVWHGDTPLIEGCVAHVVARVVDVHPAGDHTLYIGHVEYLNWWEKRPLLFFSGQYEQLITHYISDDLSWFSWR